jgi:hypothetical protein
MRTSSSPLVGVVTAREWRSFVRTSMPSGWDFLLSFSRFQYPSD